MLRDDVRSSRQPELRAAQRFGGSGGVKLLRPVHASTP